MKRNVVPASDFDVLVERISAASDALRQAAVVSVNRAVTARAWLTGYYIVEYEQHGRDRAQYGERLLPCLVQRLPKNGFSLQNLKNFRRFYMTFPALAQPIGEYLERAFPEKRQSLTVFFPAPRTLPPIGQSLTVFSGPGNLLSQAGENLDIDPQALFSRLSLTHLIELLPLPDPLQRTFYAFSAIRGTWSVRELRRQIESRCYERSGWSRDPAKLAALADARAEKETALDTLRSPHVFEFLGLASKDVWEESDLEQAIVDHLQAFILEMGLGFCFEARQKKILIDDRYHKIDLVFYHRILKCHVLVELKAKRFDARDAASSPSTWPTTASTKWPPTTTRPSASSSAPKSAPKPPNTSPPSSNRAFSSRNTKCSSRPRNAFPTSSSAKTPPSPQPPSDP
ncbi:MAG: DUF1016 family protein [Kiritimatiellae bacterium]|nr:DUF1016 family protein [Kiritimatiellia bacterium]